MKKVILVDDDVDDLEVFRSILEEGNNITATCLDNRAELFKLLEISKSYPDLIILDLFLNQDSGLEILKLIKSKVIILFIYICSRKLLHHSQRRPGSLDSLLYTPIP